ncbi:hypothetical protein BCR33DRAFT_714249 [Rhizoclosmatium globosum]|uniref:L domain-like protein n=1 Tax=Rhizoclosmatium globosum TaxID=329046 RepID=A0A1Y2CNF7_9FUNG|nr:hypothetical protein BCR33DRAFT_714249 [Rhizoclosmatium globosum]|eukprot:ORY48476.1 hypothetical protein BCR33DRAFT_714249 [Rhizoclosmatium globosum]
MVAANDCALAKSSWPEFFGAIDSSACCSSDGTVSGVNCPPGPNALAQDNPCVVQCQNSSITLIKIIYRRTSSFPDLSGLTQLTSLDIESDLIGTVPTVWPPALRALSLNCLSLIGPFPAFNQITALTFLFVANTQLSGPLPALPTTITFLHLANNRNIGIITELPTAVETLNLLSTGTGTLPSLKPLKRLQSLEILLCNFTGAFPELPSSLPRFTVEDTNFTGPLPKLPDSLQTFSITRTLQTGPIPNLPSSLQAIRIDGVQLSGSLPFWESLSNLNSISISGVNISGIIPTLPSNLTALVIYNSLITGSIPPLPPRLMDLVLDYNQLSGKIPTLPSSLGLLSLSNNNLNGTIPDIHNLRDMDLSNNQFSGTIPPSITLELVNQHQILLDGNCFSNAAAYNITNVCPSANVIMSENAIYALSDNEYVDKAKAFKLTIVPACMMPCQNNIPGYSSLDSDTTALNTTCLAIDSNPDSLKAFTDCAGHLSECSDTVSTGTQKALIFVNLLSALCKQYTQPSPEVLVTNTTISFSFNQTGISLFGFQAFVSTANGTFVAGSKFDIFAKPLGVPASAHRKRDNLEAQTISIPCDSKASSLHLKYVAEDSTAYISDANKLGHYKQRDIDLTVSGTGCQHDTAIPIKTTAAVVVPVLTTDVIISPPSTTTAVIVVTTTIAIPPQPATEIIAPPVVTTTILLPPKTIPDTSNSGTGGSNSGSGYFGNQGGIPVNSADNGGSNGNTSNGTVGADSQSGNTAESTSGNTSTGNASAGNMAANSGNGQNSNASPNTGLLQVPSAKAQTIVASVLSISSSFGPVDATELQNSLVSVEKDIVPGAPLVTVAAPSFPKANGGMNKIVLSVDSNSFKFPSSSGQVQTYNEASSSGSGTVSTAQGATVTIVLTLPDSVNTVLYGFQLSDASDNFIISVFKADDSRTPLATISYSVQAQGAKRDGGKITVVMGVAKVRATVTASAVTVVAPAKTFGSVDAQVLITSGAFLKSLQMAIPLLWLIL